VWFLFIQGRGICITDIFAKNITNTNIMINPKYPFICGYAVAVYGHPCYNKDIDVWIEISL
jgi:hypothetical protein